MNLGWRLASPHVSGFFLGLPPWSEEGAGCLSPGAAAGAVGLSAHARPVGVVCACALLLPAWVKKRCLVQQDPRFLCA